MEGDEAEGGRAHRDEEEIAQVVGSVWEHQSWAPAEETHRRLAAY